MGVPGRMIASALNLVVAQRLARRLCDSCKEAYECVAGADLAEGTRVWRAIAATGARDRLPRSSAALRADADPRRGSRPRRGLVGEDLRRGRAGRDANAREDGLRLCREGLSSLDEIRRVTGMRLI
jgi:type II secretory ATPase GspE/PulE/Tfp pilus assembly ATPase PilB-like protein